MGVGVNTEIVISELKRTLYHFRCQGSLKSGWLLVICDQCREPQWQHIVSSLIPSLFFLQLWAPSWWPTCWYETSWGRSRMPCCLMSRTWPNTRTADWDGPHKRDELLSTLGPVWAARPCRPRTHLLQQNISWSANLSNMKNHQHSGQQRGKNDWMIGLEGNWITWKCCTALIALQDWWRMTNLKLKEVTS